ncbi:MAG TPA: histidine kinase [Burkholderiaceae bacterium]|nr:histidine kinase [Burkholderiaceae bacterium]
MSLRLQINLIITALVAVFVALLVWERIDDTRRSVREEIEGSSLVATQVLRRVSEAYGYGGLPAMVTFLQQLGRVRANDITLFDARGNTLYRSPPFTYKAGRSAPAWFSRIVEPPLNPVEIRIDAGRMVLRADPSRAALDGWDELSKMLVVAAVGFALVSALVYGLAGIALRPLTRVADALQRIGQGEYGVRVPLPRGAEARRISVAMNRMAQSVQDSVAATEAAAEARARLAESRRLTRIIQERIEHERRAIARELHDELGQQITAIKSMSLSIAQRTEPHDATSAQTARLVATTAAQMYDGVHRLISRLRPLPLDEAGLGEALVEMIAEWRARQPAIEFSLDASTLPAEIPEAVATAAYRIVQEAVTNAVRHSGGTRVAVSLAVAGAAIDVRVVDNGSGLPPDWTQRGRLGLAGLRERVLALAGELSFAPAQPHGVDLKVRLPLAASGWEEPRAAAIE